MFYNRNHFNAMPDDFANLATKIANQVIDLEGRVIYGIERTDNSLEGFSTKKKPNDTSVAIAIGLATMGILSPSKTPVKIDRPTEDDFARAMQLENEYLKKKISRLEGGQ